MLLRAGWLPVPAQCLGLCFEGFLRGWLVLRFLTLAHFLASSCSNSRHKGDTLRSRYE